MIAQQLLRPTYAVAMSLYQLQYRRSVYSLYKCNLGSTYIYLRLYISATDLSTVLYMCILPGLPEHQSKWVYRHYILYHSKHPGWYSYFSEFHYDKLFPCIVYRSKLKDWITQPMCERASTYCGTKSPPASCGQQLHRQQVEPAVFHSRRLLCAV